MKLQLNFTSVNNKTVIGVVGMAETARTAKAIVTRGRYDRNGWKMEEVHLRPLQDGELLVRMAASGVCHTDLEFGNRPNDIGGWPRVMGHEGSGYVEQVGGHVEVAAVGDLVLLSFASCRECRLCQHGHASHCVDAGKLNFLGNKTFSSKINQNEPPDILGCFFGQSSFSSLSIIHESSVVNVKGLVRSDDELRLFAPLGCGIQTGSGTILNVAEASQDDAVAVIGAGGVGLSATMAAKIVGCHTIIVIDRVQARLDLAKELGATHTIDTASFTDLQQLVDEVRSLTDGYSTSITMDGTGVLPLIKIGLEFTARRGQYIQVGSSKPESVLTIPLQDFMVSGKRIIGAVEGQVVPQEYIPRMIEWFREGRFPFDRFTKEYPEDEFEAAIAGMSSGAVIKLIIRW